MSVKHFWHKNEDGSPSFLCGTVSVICDYFNVELLENRSDLFIACDVFCIGSSNEIPLLSAIKSRFVTYMQNIYADEPKEFTQDLEQISFKLKKSRYGFDKTLYSILENRGASRYVTDSQISNLCASICHYFSIPKAVYTVSDDTFKENRLIKVFYVNKATDILFVEFIGYVLMLVIGIET